MGLFDGTEIEKKRPTAGKKDYRATLSGLWHQDQEFR
jgi:hypothetical protein